LALQDYSVDTTFRTTVGQRWPGRLVGHPVVDVDGHAFRVEGLLWDLSDLTQSNQTSLRLSERLADACRVGGVETFHLNLEQGTSTQSAGLAELLQIPGPFSLLGDFIQQRIAPEQQLDAWTQWRALLEHHVPWVGRYSLVGASSPTIEWCVRPEIDNGWVRGLWGSVRGEEPQMGDVEGRQDPLTKLWRRRHFESLVDDARLDGTPLAIVLVDLDGFRQINNRTGYEGGDAVLREMGQRLQDLTVPGESVGRVAGDQFAILLHLNSESVDPMMDLSIRLTRIQAGLRWPYQLTEAPLHLTACVGVVQWPKESGTATSLMRQALSALFEAKQSGPGTVRHYSSSPVISGKEDLDLVARLLQAVERHEFDVVYQPILDLESGNISSVEALVRWRANDGTGNDVMPPSQFLALAERSRVIVDIGDQVLTQAAVDAQRLREVGLPVRVAVNVSAVQFDHAHLVRSLERLLADHGLEPNQLEIELTETAVLLDTDIARRTLDRIHALGIKVAIDDFGSGYAGLKMLQQLPADRLKLDASFVQSLGESPEAETIAKMVVALAKSLGREAVAEGVETQDQLEWLTQAGFTAVQGYLISPPRRIGDLIEWLRLRNDTRDADRDAGLDIDFDSKELPAAAGSDSE